MQAGFKQFKSDPESLARARTEAASGIGYLLIYDYDCFLFSLSVCNIYMAVNFEVTCGSPLKHMYPWVLEVGRFLLAGSGSAWFGLLAIAGVPGTDEICDEHCSQRQACISRRNAVCIEGCKAEGMSL